MTRQPPDPLIIPPPWNDMYGPRARQLSREAGMYAPDPPREPQPTCVALCLWPLMLMAAWMMPRGDRR